MCSTAWDTPRRNNRDITYTAQYTGLGSLAGALEPEEPPQNLLNPYPSLPQKGASWPSLSALPYHPRGLEPHQEPPAQSAGGWLVQDHALGRPAARSMHSYLSAQGWCQELINILNRSGDACPSEVDRRKKRLRREQDSEDPEGRKRGRGGRSGSEVRLLPNADWFLTPRQPSLPLETFPSCCCHHHRLQ